MNENPNTFEGLNLGSSGDKKKDFTPNSILLSA